MRALTLAALVSFLLAFAPHAVHAQAEPVEVVENTAQSVFGADVRELRFGLRARASEDRIRSVMLLYYVDDSSVQNSAIPNFQPGSSVTAVYLWRVAGLLAPGSEIKYQWQIETDSGKKHTTSPQTVAFTDGRFQWREMKGDQVTLYWHDLDQVSAQSLLDEARRAQSRLRTDYGLTLDRPVRIYTYARAQDYSSAVATAGRRLEGAMTFAPDRIFVLIQPGAEGMSNALQAVRQEISTAVFVQRTDNPYGPPPQWLAEGFSLFLGGQAVSDNNQKALQQFAKDNRLLPLRALNGNFPSTDNERALAYAESLSVVKFMFDTYGAEKVRATLAAFKEGTTVDDGLKKGLGVTLEQLETRWKNSLKSGSAARPVPKGGAVSPEDPVARVFGVQAVEFWQGIFGPNGRLVLVGGALVAVIAVVGVVVGSVFAAIRKARQETEDL
ncbi:MAG TPA: peptidase MA family metallohydrolase [Chloroflexota bacterium]|nr:peptidase MA family metallohydrolase [Chloroflexota bacterium]